MTEKSQAGREEDVGAFRTVFEATYTDLLRFAERRVHPAAAEEVVAEVFLVAWRRRADVPREARPWLFGIARNVMLNHHRENRRRAALQVRVRDDPASGADGELADHVARHLDLLSAWRLLDEHDQETIALIAWDQLTPTEAATVVGCSRGTFAVRLHRARARLRRHLDGPDVTTADRPARRTGRTDFTQRTEGAPR